ncbi:glycosyltransferase [Oceanibaculum indicum]|uniref:Glycosyltransferase n=1 Tax=Oceanibaculum indicum P24 TaxID=1207063 RepID=K2J5Y3_9PROT|nr:glycosyltransferase [Oceanibaculum indicum]EKE70292.1 glycosyltransferase [Oceanibaculum indicum P24]
MIRVLHLVHNHPDAHPGGTEIQAQRLVRALNAEGRVEAHLAAATRQPPHPGTILRRSRGGRDTLLAGGAFDRFLLSQRDRRHFLTDFTRFLALLNPQAVHLHHLYDLGAEIVAVIRRTLPDARIILSLHDFHLPCHRDGLMVTGEGALCETAQPKACAACCPGLSAADFQRRRLFLSAHLDLVDGFIAPSLFALERYAAWGLPRRKLHHLPNIAPDDLPPETLQDRRRDRLGYFGNLLPHKGLVVLLRACVALKRAGQRFSLSVHGDDRHMPDSYRQEIAPLLAELGEAVTLHGGYAPEQASHLMRDMDWGVAPSVWWENDPLVLQEALAARRPVIASDIGGMAEVMRRQSLGLLVPVSDADALAEILARCLGEPVLWTDCRAAMKPDPAQHDLVPLLRLYGGV